MTVICVGWAKTLKFDSSANRSLSIFSEVLRIFYPLGNHCHFGNNTLHSIFSDIDDMFDIFPACNENLFFCQKNLWIAIMPPTIVTYYVYLIKWIRYHILCKGRKIQEEEQKVRENIRLLRARMWKYFRDKWKRGLEKQFSFSAPP